MITVILFFVFSVYTLLRLKKWYKIYRSNRRIYNEIKSVALIDQNTTLTIVSNRSQETLVKLIQLCNYTVRTIPKLTDSDIDNKDNVYIIMDGKRDRLPKKHIIYISSGLTKEGIVWYTDKTYYTNQKNSFYMENTAYQVARNLLGITKDPWRIRIDFPVKPGVIYCVHLPECDRLDYFTKQTNYREISNTIVVYPAIKYTIGWQGCAFSHLNLIYNAQQYNLNQVTICEDDCLFPDEFNTKYTIINEFLQQHQDWDIFVGVIADLPEDTILTNVYEFKGVTFLELNRMVSTVFNIYHRRSFERILKWQPKDATIDRFIGNLGMKYIASFPFQFSCLNVDSTIFGKNLYHVYNNLFEKSNVIIRNLIKIKKDN